MRCCRLTSGHPDPRRVDAFTQANDLARNRQPSFSWQGATFVFSHKQAKPAGGAGHSSPCLQAGAFWPQKGKSEMRDDIFAPAATPGDPGGTGGALPLPRSRRGTFLRRSAGIVLGTAIALLMLSTLGFLGFLMMTHLTRPSSLGTATYTTTTPSATPGQSAPDPQASSATVTLTQASETEKGPATLSA